MQQGCWLEGKAALASGSVIKKRSLNRLYSKVTNAADGCSMAAIIKNVRACLTMVYKFYKLYKNLDLFTHNKYSNQPL